MQTSSQEVKEGMTFAVGDKVLVDVRIYFGYREFKRFNFEGTIVRLIPSINAEYKMDIRSHPLEGQLYLEVKPHTMYYPYALPEAICTFRVRDINCTKI